MDMNTEGMADVIGILDSSLRIASDGASQVATTEDVAPTRGLDKITLGEHGPVPEEGEWEEVGKVDRAVVYPIKSAMGTQLGAVKVTKTGLESLDGLIRDRTFVIMEDMGDGKMLRIRISDKYPTMVLIQTNFVKKAEDKPIIVMSAPGMEDIEVELDTGKKSDKINVFTEPCEAVDLGDAVSAWLTDFLLGPESNRRLRLMWHSETGTTRTRTIEFPGLKKDEMPVFADISPISLLSEESVKALEDDVRERNGDDRIGIDWRRFRPNLVISGVSKPNDEDDFEYVKIGSTILKTVILTPRCQRIVTDPDTGSQQDSRGEPLRTLFATRRSLDPEERQFFNRMPVFATALALVLEGEIRVGDKVYARRWSNRDKK